MKRIGLPVLLLLLCATTVSAQEVDSTSVHVPDSLSQTIPPAVAAIERSELPVLGRFGSWTWSRDSLSLLPYQRFSDILELHPFISVADLGNFGQPHAMIAAGALPETGSFSVGGLPYDDMITGMKSTDMLATEDAQSITVYPQYQAFWYGSPGDVFAADVEEKQWKAARPITRLRHTEAANDYLYTDVMFTLDPSENGSLYIAGSRMTIGGTAGGNTARFENSAAENWNLRGRYAHRFSDLLSASLTLRYHDELTYLNGGTLGIYDSTSGLYRYDESDADFADAAFSPIDATLVNPSMETHRQRYTATAALRMQWTRDSSQVTLLRLHTASDVRRFRDAEDEDWLDLGVATELNESDHWSTVRLQLDHETALSWARLLLRGHAARFSMYKGGETLSEEGLETGARGRLDLLLGPVALSGFAALDYRYDQTALSIGAGGELPLGALSLWGGVSFSPRIRSYLFSDYRPSLLITSGDRSPDLDKVSIAEGGLRLRTSWLDLDLRGFVRREDRYLLVQASSALGAYPGRYTLSFTDIPDGAALTSTGAAATLGLTYWRLHLDQQGTLQQSSSSHPLLDVSLTPERRYRASLYYRGNLIEGTLDLRVGGTFTYASAFVPLVYYPNADIFVLPTSLGTGARDFTGMQRVDLFLFATIKQKATLSVILYNVLDTDYITTTFYPMYDRAMRIGVDWIFFD